MEPTCLLAGLFQCADIQVTLQGLLNPVKHIQARVELPTLQVLWAVGL